MRKVSLILTLAVVLSAVFFVIVQAGDEKDKQAGAATIEGVLVDTKCYSTGGFVENTHKDADGNDIPNCATACASMGIPVAVLDADKNVHVIAGPASGYAGWMSKEVRMHGMFGKYARVFIPDKIEVKEDGKWVKKDVPGTMM